MARSSAVTDEKASEAAVLRREHHLRSVLATVPDAMVVMDEHGTISSFSKAAEKLFGYTGSQVVGQNVGMLMPPTERREPGSPGAVTLGRWGMAVSLVIGAVLVGRVIRTFPYLLPNRLPGLIVYELGPGLVLALAISAAVIITRDSGPGLGALRRLALFTLAALIAGIAALGWEFALVLQGQWP